MKSKSHFWKATLAATALLSLSSADAWARTPRARELCGVIQTVDTQTHTLTVESPERDEPLTLVVKRQTKFIKNWKFTEPGSLRKGQYACVYYRSPLFGKPFVTKVVWSNGQTPNSGGE